MANRMMRWFEYAHLPPHLQVVSRLCAVLAEDMDDHLPEGAEKTAGLRKLLEAKDCFVRARIEAEDPLDTRNPMEMNVNTVQTQVKAEDGIHDDG